MKVFLEREFKLQAQPGFRLPDLPGERLAPRVFTSVYYDTADHRLARRGMTLRCRTERRRPRWQLKLPRGAARLELTVPGGAGVPPEALTRLLVASTRGGALVPIATLRTRRAGVRVRDLDGSVAEVVLDSVAVLEQGRVVRRIREIEGELLTRDEAALERIQPEP